MIGRLLAVLGAALVVFVFTTGTGTAVVASAGCAHPCSGGATQSIAPTGHPMPAPCIRDVGCGGAAALGTGVAVAAVVLPTTGPRSVGVGGWRRVRVAGVRLLGRLPAGGLFRPPQVLVNA